VCIRDRSRPGHAENRAPSGCRAWLCAGGTSRRRIPLRTRSMPGSLGWRDEVNSPGHEAGRRRAIGAVAALSIIHSRPRRWCDAGPLRRIGVTAAQKAGAEGRATGSRWKGMPRTHICSRRTNVEPGTHPAFFQEYEDEGTPGPAAGGSQGLKPLPTALKHRTRSFAAAPVPAPASDPTWSPSAQVGV